MRISLRKISWLDQLQLSNPRKNNNRVAINKTRPYGMNACILRELTENPESLVRNLHNILVKNESDYFHLMIERLSTTLRRLDNTISMLKNLCEPLYT